MKTKRFDNSILFFIGILLVQVFHIYAEEITYEVTGVAANDSLNIRADANASSRIIGKIPFDGKGIVRLPDSEKSGNWCKIKYGSIAGWVHCRFLAQEGNAAFKEQLTCIGTEPFWSMELHKEKLILSNPMDEKREYKVKKFQQSMNNTNQWFVEAEKSTGEKVTFYLIEASCSDDMSDSKYKFKILIHDTKNDQTINGCCNKIN